jgi:hypothetical protein
MFAMIAAPRRGARDRDRVGVCAELLVEVALRAPRAGDPERATPGPGADVRDDRGTSARRR